MSGNRRLPELLDGLSPEALGLFCLTCAERARAVYETLASDADVAYYDRLLELAWASAVGDADEDDVASAFEAAEERLVPDEESPEGERFYVEQAGLLVLNAVAAQLNPSPHAATLSSNTLETLTESLDHLLAGSPVQIREADRPEPPLGPLQRVERGAQQAVLTRLRGSSGGQGPGRGPGPGPGHVDLATLREQAAVPVRRIAEGVAAAKRQGWNALAGE